eukprot:Em0001g1515a
MLCATRHSFSRQYLQINELLDQLLRDADAEELHKSERELGCVLNSSAKSQGPCGHVGKEMHLQPPSLMTMARARLAVAHFGLDKVLKTPVQELLSEVC